MCSTHLVIVLLEAGQRLVLAKNAGVYDGNGYPVAQWDVG